MCGNEIKEDCINSYRKITESLCDCTDIDKQIDIAIERYNELTIIMQAFIRENEVLYWKSSRQTPKNLVEYK